LDHRFIVVKSKLRTKLWGWRL